METLTYSTDPATALNQARLQLWCSKDALSRANQRNDNEMKACAMRWINKDRFKLAEIARELRKSLPPKKCYKALLAASTLQFEVTVWANNRRDAVAKARLQAGDRFSLARLDEVENVQRAH